MWVPPLLLMGAIVAATASARIQETTDFSVGGAGGRGWQMPARIGILTDICHT
jgi:hypothetical protein